MRDTLCQSVKSLFPSIWNQLVILIINQGSHGVWGVDDYYLLPYLFGSSQLASSKLKPADIHNKEILEHFQTTSSNSYLYFDAIRFINSTKSGPFFEHSPMLNDISNSKSWQKVRQGMLRWYIMECCTKFVVIQHFKIGNVFALEPYTK